MMTLFGQSYAWNAPEVLLIGGVVLVLAGLLLLTLRAAGRSASMTAPLMREMGWLGQRVQSLSEGQERLAGGPLRASACMFYRPRKLKPTSRP